MVVHLFNRSRTSSSPPIVPTVPDDERVYAIGDIHGRHDLLIRLLARIHEDATRFSDGRRVRIVFLGDYIDRGEDSRKVLDALLHLMAPPTGSIVVLRGNHEAALLDFLDDPLAGASWLEFGGLQTLASFGIAAPRSWSDRRGRRAARDALWSALEPYAPLFEAMQDVYRSGDVVFSHAGFEPGRSPDDQSASALLWGNPKFLVDQPLEGLRAVHGHFDAEIPASLPGRICVDTGAYYSGVLTAVRLDDGEAFLSAR